MEPASMSPAPLGKIELRRIRPERNERRFYVLDIAFDLFGNVGLLRNWGRIGTGGRIRFDVHSDEAAAEAALCALAATKQRRGYRAITRAGTVNL